MNISSSPHPASAAQSPTARINMNFDAGWLFSLGEFAEAPEPDFDDSSWTPVKVPHDWSSDGPFEEKYGSGNGYAPAGVGWYRKHFTLDPGYQGKRVQIEFDGVYDNSEVWVNGQFVGRRPYGYISFSYDISQFVKFGTENVVSVRVDHSRYADSRWYSGSGIYRHVHVLITNPIHIATWGTYVTTPSVTDKSARTHIETTVVNESTNTEEYSVKSDVIGADGSVVGTQTSTAKLAGGATGPVVQDITIEHPTLWSTDAPNLYTIHSQVLVNGALQDDTVTPFGVRTVKFDPNKGFFLNGHEMKLKGVCIHHDAGSVGAAVPDGVLWRRLVLLKSLGVNAIRTSHNPPAPEMLDMCDQLGFLVMDEAFDEFTPTKNKWVHGWTLGKPSKFGYGEYFADWSHRDIQDMVRQDRNHPSIILWSIGNEVDTPNDPFSDPILGSNYRPQNPPAINLVKLGKPLVDAIKELDKSRPITSALASIIMSDAVGFGDILDVDGYNYQEGHYAEDHKKYPHRVIFGSENGHSYQSWVAVRDNDYISGQFLWTGIDYLGESHGWPARANGAGLLDLCGFKKPLGWFRQSLWSEQPVVYICTSPVQAPAGSTGNTGAAASRPQERWDWPTGTATIVSCYTNCPEVRLSLNGTVIGDKKASDAVDGVLTWEVPFTSGNLTAEGMTDNKVSASFSLQTPGPANRLVLLPDTTTLAADGQAVCNLEFQVVDSNGVRIPDDSSEITFTVTGPAVVLGLGNGNISDLQSGRGLTHHTYQGRGLAILQSTNNAGAITITASSPGLTSATTSLKSN